VSRAEWSLMLRTEVFAAVLIRFVPEHRCVDELVLRLAGFAEEGPRRLAPIVIPRACRVISMSHPSSLGAAI
jgi:hypothetical protein